MGNQRLDFEHPTSDSGERNDTDAISPFNNGERVIDTVLNRPGENLRYRSEILRRETEDQNFRSDQCTKWIIHGGSIAGAGTYIEGDVLPYITDWTPDELGAGNPPTDPAAPERGRFVIDAAQPMILESILSVGQDHPHVVTLSAENAAPPRSASFTLTSLYQAAEGGDTVKLVWAYTAVTATLNVSVTGDPKHIINVEVSNDGSVTLDTVRLALAADADVTNLVDVSAPITGDSGTTIDITDLDYPAAGDYLFDSQTERQAYLITNGVLHAFFEDTPAGPPYNLPNLLKDGDTLGIYYPYMTDPVAFFGTHGMAGEQGGRRQATLTNDLINAVVRISAGQLFNSSREPEKVAMGIPICKRIGDSLHFVDGTYVPEAFATPADLPEGIHFGENGYTLLHGVVNNAVVNASPAAAGTSVDLWGWALGPLYTILVSAQNTINDRASLGSAETVTGSWLFSAAQTFTNTLTVDTAAITATGNGIGAGGFFTGGVGSANGVRGVGGTTGGSGGHFIGTGISGGVYGKGGNTDGVGVYGLGVAAGAGVHGQGGNPSGTGVLGVGGTAGVGVIGEGAGAQEGGRFTGGTTSTMGVLGLGSGSLNGIGVRGDGNGSGAGGYFEGSAGGSGVGVHGQGGGSDAAGVYGVGGATNGNGVEGVGAGTGAGVHGTGAAVAHSPGVYGISGIHRGVGGKFEGADDGANASPAVFMVPNTYEPSLDVQGYEWYVTDKQAKIVMGPSNARHPKIPTWARIHTPGGVGPPDPVLMYSNNIAVGGLSFVDVTGGGGVWACKLTFDVPYGLADGYVAVGNVSDTGNPDHHIQIWEQHANFVTVALVVGGVFTSMKTAYEVSYNVLVQGLIT